MFPAQVNKGPLVPGQVIQVNKFSVQVERYLAQGGYAHVYLVRTPTPVYNTTHHVLKRMGVPNEAMLAEVKKEVDTMRLLQGHPNIVHLIDASWQKAPNGTYEVYILMEYCPGGGIIDMMNRRLRERLTEAEILQIFVDVCEGVAYMHNLRPPLLHRDLKVENILQSSSTSYKLCDFGSAKAVARTPANNQEIRALEADLNKHTTLQYRAPEMIDLYQRRPVDEKSDVWALGVLLYKLCYYTTPFEEHPTLAILNVQYKFPPYPVYSPRMNQLIASMLQEHGMRRPTAFELLDYVHSLRGTKSRFKYAAPAPSPLSPRQPKVTSPSTPSGATVPTAPKPISMSVLPSKSQPRAIPNGSSPNPVNHAPQEHTSKPGTPADARYPEPQIVPPMRRGRPATASKENVPLAQLKLDLSEETAKANKNWLDEGFGDDGNRSWKPIASQSATPSKENMRGAWTVEKRPESKAERQASVGTGFGDNFGDKLWDSFGKQESKDPGKLSPGVSPLQPSARLSPRLAAKRPSPALPPTRSSRDAFEGLGLHLSPDRPAPTLGEARKLRTGLALMSASGFKMAPNKSPVPTPKLSPSPGLPPSIQLPPTTVVKSPSTSETLISTPSSRFRAGLTESPGPSKQLDALPAENRFPSLEELDASFPTQSNFSGQPLHKADMPIRNVEMSSTSSMPPAIEHRDPNSLLAPVFTAQSRPEQRTGSAVRKQPSYQDYSRAGSAPKAIEVERSPHMESRPRLPPRTSTFSSTNSGFSEPSPSASSSTLARKAAEGSLTKALGKQNDWLTGDDHHHLTQPSPSSSVQRPSSSKGKPILRDSPVKRASVMHASVPFQSAISAEPDRLPEPPEAQPEQLISVSPPPPPPLKSSELESTLNTKHGDGPRLPASSNRPQRSRMSTRNTDVESSPDEEGPEDVGTSTFRRSIGTKTSVPAPDPAKKIHKGRQSSVHDLVDLYGGGTSFKDKDRDLEARLAKSPRSRMSVSPLPTSAASTTLSFTGNATPSGLLSLPKSSTVEMLSPPSPSSRKHQPRQTTGASPAKSRPQSMLLFPSKSIDSRASPTSPKFPISPTGETTDENRRKTMRRTSISDMVLRYEGINSSSPATNAQPLPGLAKPGVRPIAHVNDKEINTRSTPTFQRHGASSTNVPASLGESLLPSLSKPSAKFPSGAVQPLPGLAKPLTTGSGDKGSRPRTMSSTTKEKPVGPPKSPTRKSTLSSSPPENRRVAPRHRVNSSVSKEKDEGTPRHTPVKLPGFPPPKPLTDEQLMSPDNRSPSPERPYQGVGKLIDQWQRKTEGANPSRAPGSPKRIVNKRSGTVYHS